jgi:hypothetical protein
MLKYSGHNIQDFAFAQIVCSLYTFCLEVPHHRH